MRRHPASEAASEEVRQVDGVNVGAVCGRHGAQPLSAGATGVGASGRAGLQQAQVNVVVSAHQLAGQAQRQTLLAAPATTGDG